MATGSLALLEFLNGYPGNRLGEWLASRRKEPRIAWYPSAGADFSDLLFFHPRYRKVHPTQRREPAAPDIFIHTDYNFGAVPAFMFEREHYADRRTKISVEYLETLPSLRIPIHEDLVHGSQGFGTNKVMLLDVHVNSDRLGSFSRLVIYAVTENAGFCSKYLVPAKATVSHIMQVRYGNGLGGGLSSPGWIRHQFGILNTEVVATADNAIGGDDSTNDRVFGHFPNLRNPESPLETWRPLRTTEYGTPPFITHLQWYLVKKRRGAD